jgi:uncharacterized BrkB/YihY/UPF0761 family membrane protein
MNDLLDKLKSTKWWTILKALPFDGGPSSTRWVFLGGFATVAVCLLSLTGALIFVYVRTPDHHVDIALLGAVVTTIGTVVGFATNAQNKKNTLPQSSD